MKGFDKKLKTMLHKLPVQEPKDELWVMSKPVSKAPDKPAYVEIGFEQGVPVKLDGKATDSVKLLQTLNEIGGKGVVQHAYAQPPQIRG